MSRKFVCDDCTPLDSAVKRGEVLLDSYGRGQYPGRRLKPKQLPGLRSIGVWNSVGPQNWGLPMHRNDGIEICYVCSGQIDFATDSGEWCLRAGDMTITRPWQRHRLGNPNVTAAKVFWIILDVDSDAENSIRKFPDWTAPDDHSRRELLRIYRLDQRCYLRRPAVDFNRAVVQKYEAIQPEDPLLTAHLAAVINTALVTFAGHLLKEIDSKETNHSGYNQTIGQFFGGFQASVDKASEPWTLDAMAHACRVGKSYLTSTCHELFNTTPSEQLNLIRLHHAKQLLKSNLDRSITEIAFSVGFNSSQYFANRFKKHVGCTPLDYRNRQSV
jgi:AraC-like DNA-binding protein/uncharacterized cupin superfamily protein